MYSVFVGQVVLNDLSGREWSAEALAEIKRLEGGE